MIFGTSKPALAASSQWSARLLYRSQAAFGRRTLTTSTLRRPTVFPTSRTSNPITALLAPVNSTTPNSITGEALDLLPKISTHPALAGTQVRNGPRNTMTGFTHFKRKRRIGFLARKRSRTGQQILMRRRLKRRYSLAH